MAYAENISCVISTDNDIKCENGAIKQEESITGEKVKTEDNSDNNNENELAKEGKKKIIKVTGANLKSVLRDIKKKKKEKQMYKIEVTPVTPLPDPVTELIQPSSIPTLNIEDEKIFNMTVDEVEENLPRSDDEETDSDPTPAINGSTPGKQGLVKKEYKYVKEPTVCSDCGQVLSSKDSLRQHRKRFHKEQGDPFPCEFCGKIFYLKEFPCEFCGKIFYLKEDCRKHIVGMHGSTERYPCDLCRRGFRRLNSLKAHKLKAHDIGTRYSCNVCYKLYSSLQSLKRHYEVHQSKEDMPDVVDASVTEMSDKGWMLHKCSMCAESFNTQNGLNKHLRVMHSVKNRTKINYSCAQCAKGFAQASMLRRHMVIHMETKPFRCKTCNRGFTFQNSLSRHERIHSGENLLKRHQCHLCNRSFNEFSSLKRHILIHTNILPYQCAGCGERFRHTTAKARHAAKMHPPCKKAPVVGKSQSSNPFLYGVQILEETVGDRLISHVTT